MQDNREIPDTMEVLWDFGATLIAFIQVNGNGSPVNLKGSEMELRGTKGTMFIAPNGWEVIPEDVTETPRGANSPLERASQRRRPGEHKTLIEARTAQGSVWADAPHARNFLDCAKSRGKCHADGLSGHLSTSATLIANIALKTEAMLKWDAQAERFTHNAAANQWLHYQYRAPYKLNAT